MNLQALLVSNDDLAADVLGRTLPLFGIALDRSSNLETAVARIEEQKFDALVVDFDDPQGAGDFLDHATRLGSGRRPLTVALVADASRVRDILSSGAHFVLYKPVSEPATRAALLAVAALLNRERRRSYRVPVQAPVELTRAGGGKFEGILIDLSENGMDVLTAEPQNRGEQLGFRFELPLGALMLEAQGQVAWSNPNGQTGVRFMDLSPAASAELKAWVTNAATSVVEPSQSIPHCMLTDLSLGGCYVKTDAPFPERSLVDLCLKAGEMEVHTEGMVRVLHPGHGMGVEFPSRTAEQRAQVGNLIDMLRTCPQAMLELTISPRALEADLAQFESAEEQPPAVAAQMEHQEMEHQDDALLELLRRGTTLQQEDFLAELHRQRSSENLASV
jgi:CheY-like chemotaxis protein